MDLSHIENALFLLNYRWKSQALAMWKGERPPFDPFHFYNAWGGFVGLETLAWIDRLSRGDEKLRLRHALLDHYLQRALLPHEAEMRSWTRGAAAHVNGRKIYFRDIIPWCQKQSTLSDRRMLQKETGPLCKFLAPFALNYWTILLEMLTKELGYKGYVDYCREKKGLDYAHYYSLLKEFLPQSDDIYFPAMDRWCREGLGCSLGEMTRFDAIHLLGLGQMDPLFPDKPACALLPFFERWGIDIERTPGLYLDLGRVEGKSSQAISFLLEVPEEVYILMTPEGGWIDLETLWHELGHGLSAVYTSPDLSIVSRDLASGFSLSESFAFLNQNVAMSTPFLTTCLALDRTVAEDIHYYKVLKDISLFRRYGAKFLAEYEMFQGGDLSDGRRYAELMARYTGFYYQPESHLFDLVPEFYSLDYVLGWLTESILEAFLRDRLGEDWMLQEEGGRILKEWWGQGNVHDTPSFLERNGLEPVNTDRILMRWKQGLS